MPPDPTQEQVKKEIKEALTRTRKPIIIESCLDLILSQINESQTPTNAYKELSQMFDGYFSRQEHDPLEGDPSDLHDYFQICNSDIILASKQPSSAKKTGEKRMHDEALNCCLPCSCLTLDGNRALLDLTVDPPKKIKNIEYADAFWDWFVERTDIDIIGGKILSDLEFGGKFQVLYDSPVGIISQVMINEINRGMSSRRKQRTSKSLKTIGMRLDKDYAGLKLSDIEIAPGMIIGLQLIAKMEDFYNSRRVIQTIEKIAATQQSQQTIASIRTSIDLLKRTSEKFRYGTNAHNTLLSIAWKLAYFYLLLATGRQIGLSQERLDDIVDAARNMLILNKIGTPSDKSKTRIYVDCANNFRDLILHILSPMEFGERYWYNDDKIKALLDIEEPRVETFIANFKEATGIDLTDKRWLREDAVVSHDLPNKL